MHSPRRAVTVVAVLAGSTLVFATCRDSGTTGPRPGGARPVVSTAVDTSAIALRYLCGNSFAVQNWSDAEAILTYAVDDTVERGSVTLPPRPADTTYSETFLTTRSAGRVTLYAADTVLVREAANGGSACPASARAGEWTAPSAWPIVAVHVHLLPDGRVLSFGKIGDPQLWDPATNAFTAVPAPVHLFCSGHSFLPDGRLLITGGHIADDRGLPDATIFDPATGSWTSGPKMARGRWYPTNTTLANGEVLTIAGRDEAAANVGVPEVWQADGTWRALTTASKLLPYYPRTFVAPNGNVFYAGERRYAQYLSPTGTGKWLSTTYATKYPRDREYGSAVMYDAGKILIVGGDGKTSGRLPTATAEVIDLNKSRPAWRYTGTMAYRRRQLNATILPTGEVLATGGTSATGSNNPAGAVYAAESWSPTTGKWTTLASNAIIRIYHSTTLLLPDGRLLHSGSGDARGAVDQRNAEWRSRPSGRSSVVE